MRQTEAQAELKRYNQERLAQARSDAKERAAFAQGVRNWTVSWLKTAELDRRTSAADSEQKRRAELQALRRAAQERYTQPAVAIAKPPSPQARVELPVQATPVHVTPMQATPMQATPVHVTPMHVTPVQTTPMQATPMQATPMQATPVHVTPMHVTPMPATPKPRAEATSSMPSAAPPSQVPERPAPDRSGGGVALDFITRIPHAFQSALATALIKPAFPVAAAAAPALTPVAPIVRTAAKEPDARRPPASLAIASPAEESPGIDFVSRLPRSLLNLVLGTPPAPSSPGRAAPEKPAKRTRSKRAPSASRLAPQPTLTDRPERPGEAITFERARRPGPPVPQEAPRQEPPSAPVGEPKRRAGAAPAPPAPQGIDFISRVPELLPTPPQTAPKAMRAQPQKARSQRSRAAKLRSVGEVSGGLERPGEALTFDRARSH